MGIFSRLFKVGQAEAHFMVDKLEDPIKITEQGIRDLKNDLQQAMTGLAEVKGVSIRLTKEADDAKRQTDEYERKAVLLLQRFKDGQLDQAQADRLATEALNQKEITSQRAARLSQDAEQQQPWPGNSKTKSNSSRRLLPAMRMSLSPYERVPRPPNRRRRSTNIWPRSTPPALLRCWSV